MKQRTNSKALASKLAKCMLTAILAFSFVPMVGTAFADDPDLGANPPEGQQLTIQERIAALPSAEEVAAMTDEQKEELNGQLSDIMDELDQMLDDGTMTLEEYETAAAPVVALGQALLDDKPATLADKTYPVSTKDELDEALAEINAASGGTYDISLSADIASPSVMINAGREVTILGNGHSLSGVSTIHFNALSAASQAILNLKGGDGTLIISGVDNNDQPGIVYVKGPGAVLNMYDGVTLKDHKGNNYFGGGVTVQGGTFNMYGGTIDNCGIQGGSVCYGGGVAVVFGGVFNMSGGTISNCYASSSYKDGDARCFTAVGGGVFVSGGSTFVMSGGSILNNSATTLGGGIAYDFSYGELYKYSWKNPKSTVEISGGNISGNSAFYGGGICASGYYYSYAAGLGTYTPGPGTTSNPGLRITGGSIQGNTAQSLGGGLFALMLNPVVSISGAKLCNNLAGEEASDIFAQAVTSFAIPSNEALQGFQVAYNGKPTDVKGKMIDGWYIDGTPRYVNQSAAEREKLDENTSSLTGSAYSLIAAANPVPVKVTFEMNGHGAQVDPQDLTKGEKATRPADPNATGYTFGGWFTDQECTNPYDFDTPLTGDITLYAKWTVEKHTVTFDQNYEGKPADVTEIVDYGGKVAKPAADPKRDGYTFGGWFTEPACSNAYDFNTSVTADVTLYAKWTKNDDPKPDPKQSYIVSFDIQGHGALVPSQTVESGAKATEPTAPAEEGYTFGGWFIDKECTIKYDFGTSVTSNTILYAKWTKVEPTPTPDPTPNPTPDNPSSGDSSTAKTADSLPVAPVVAVAAGAALLIAFALRRMKGASRR